MPQIQVEQKIFEDLIDYKLNAITEQIDSILKNWHYNSSDKFLQDSRDGTLQEADMDAISLKQLLLERDRLNELKYGSRY